MTALSSAGVRIRSSRGPGHQRRSSSRSWGRWKKHQVPGPKFRLSAPNSPWEVRFVFFFSGFCCEEILPTWRGVQKTSIKSISLLMQGRFLLGGTFFKKTSRNCQGRHLILGQDHVYDLLMNFLSLKNIKLRDGRINRFFGVWDRTMSQSFSGGLRIKMPKFHQPEICIILGKTNATCQGFQNSRRFPYLLTTFFRDHVEKPPPHSHLWWAAWRGLNPTPPDSKWTKQFEPTWQSCLSCNAREALLEKNWDLWLWICWMGI